MSARFHAVSAEDRDRARWRSGEPIDITDPATGLPLFLRFVVYRPRSEIPSCYAPWRAGSMRSTPSIGSPRTRSCCTAPARCTQKPQRIGLRSRRDPSCSPRSLGDAAAWVTRPLCPLGTAAPGGKSRERGAG